MDALFNTTNALYARLRDFWESQGTRRAIGMVLVLVFLASLALIQVNRSMDTAPLAWFPHKSHFKAIDIAFTLILAVEVVSLIFVIPCSISRAVGNQFEILALILLRSAFKELSHFPEPIEVMGHLDSLYRILSDGCGALVVFGLLGVYRWQQRRHKDAITNPADMRRFVGVKRVIALALLGVFAYMAAIGGWEWVNGQRPKEFFPAFYTVLIFSDVLIMLLSQRFLPTFQAVFRYSGFALATLLIRLALTAGPYYNVLIGSASVLFAVLLTLVYNRLYLRHKEDGRSEV